MITGKLRVVEGGGLINPPSLGGRSPDERAKTVKPGLPQASRTGGSP